jgi:hypothetical protein
MDGKAANVSSSSMEGKAASLSSLKAEATRFPSFEAETAHLGDAWAWPHEIMLEDNCLCVEEPLMDLLGKFGSDLKNRLKVNRNDPRGYSFLHEGGNAVMLEEPQLAVVAAEDLVKTRSNKRV